MHEFITFLLGKPDEESVPNTRNCKPNARNVPYAQCMPTKTHFTKPRVPDSRIESNPANRASTYWGTQGLEGIHLGAAAGCAATQRGFLLRRGRRKRRAGRRALSTGALCSSCRCPAHFRRGTRLSPHPAHSKPKYTPPQTATACWPAFRSQVASPAISSDLHTIVHSTLCARRWRAKETKRV